MPPVVRARKPERLPVVLSREEVDAILAHLVGVAHLFVMLLYGNGLRLEECLTLRVKDVDFHRHQINVRQGGGQKDRTTMLPASAREPLTKHLADVQRLHARDLAQGFGRVALPVALHRRFFGAPAAWRWQFVEPDGSTVSGYAPGSRGSTGAPVAPPAGNLVPMNRFVWPNPPRSCLIRASRRAYPPHSAIWRGGGVGAGPAAALC
jgi:hypothetical protein